MKRQISGPLWREHVNAYVKFACVTIEETGLPPERERWLSTRGAYACYLDWCLDVGITQTHHPIRRGEFDYTLEKLGFEKKRVGSGGETRWSRLRPRGEDERTCVRCGQRVTFFIANDVSPETHEFIEEITLLRVCLNCIHEIWRKKPDDL